MSIEVGEPLLSTALPTASAAIEGTASSDGRALLGRSAARTVPLAHDAHEAVPKGGCAEFRDPLRAGEPAGLRIHGHRRGDGLICASEEA